MEACFVASKYLAVYTSLRDSSLRCRQRGHLIVYPLKVAANMTGQSQKQQICIAAP